MSGGGEKSSADSSMAREAGTRGECVPMPCRHRFDLKRFQTGAFNVALV